jgi:hypothetical protein
VIVAHHGGEVSPLLASLLAAGAFSPFLVLARARLTELGDRLRRRPRRD